ncbi:MAG: ATP-grasp domain-containing protein [Microcystaceae cyanobacterium]
MDLLEYQAKTLFQQIGIPILPSQTIHQTSELKRLQIPYPVVLKSQVRAGGRGRAGGVRFAENTIDAIAAASTIFHLAIAGEYPEVVLAEARYDSQREIFLAVVLDYQRQCPVLLGSNRGGIDVDTLLENMEQVALTEEFFPYHARRLAIKMGLKGELVPAVADIIEKMYHLFITKDLDLIEINPLGVNADGGVMALDGKITINDSAIARHQDLPILCKAEQTGLKWRSGNLQEGQIGLICSSEGFALSSWDSLKQEGGLVAGACILEETRQFVLTEQLKRAFAYFQGMENLEVILINGFDGTATARAIAELFQSQVEQSIPTVERTIRPTATVLGERKKESPGLQRTSELTPLVIRFTKGDWQAVQSQLSSLPIYWFTDLAAAINQTLTFVIPPSV